MLWCLCESVTMSWLFRVHLSYGILWKLNIYWISCAQPRVFILFIVIHVNRSSSIESVAKCCEGGRVHQMVIQDLLNKKISEAQCSGSVSFWASTSRIRIHNYSYEFESGYGSGSESFQKIEKTFISTVLWLLNDLLSLKTVVNVPTKSNTQKKLVKKLNFCWYLKSHWRKGQDPNPKPDP
jgi:hypothetical protein